MVGPLRDLFAAIFFLFFGLQIDPKTLPPVLPAALLLALVAAGTKIFSGWWAARRAGVDPKGCLRAGAVLTARGEFSIVIAGLGVSAEPRLGPLSAAFVLILAVVGPMLARAADPPLKTFGSSLPKP
jgi:CPA2 family monovalent cation:H+ antiporter-2